MKELDKLIAQVEMFLFELYNTDSYTDKEYSAKLEELVKISDTWSDIWKFLQDELHRKNPTA